MKKKPPCTFTLRLRQNLPAYCPLPAPPRSRSSAFRPRNGLWHWQPWLRKERNRKPYGCGEQPVSAKHILSTLLSENIALKISRKLYKSISIRIHSPAATGQWTGPSLRASLARTSLASLLTWHK